MWPGFKPSYFRDTSNTHFINSKTSIDLNGRWISVSEVSKLTISAQEKVCHFINSEVEVERIRLEMGEKAEWCSQVQTTPVIPRVANPNQLHPWKENWISRSRHETFPGAGLNLQIVQEHFPSNKTSYYRPVLYSVGLVVGGFQLTSSPHTLLPSQKDEKSYILAFTKWSPKQLNTGSSLPCLINRILSVDCLPTTSSVSPIN